MLLTFPLTVVQSCFLSCTGLEALICLRGIEGQSISSQTKNFSNPPLPNQHLSPLCFYFKGQYFVVVVVSRSITDHNNILYEELMYTDTPDASRIPLHLLRLHRRADHIASAGLSALPLFLFLPPTPTFSQPACCQYRPPCLTAAHPSH